MKIFKFFFSAQFGVLPANTTKVQLSEREPTFQTEFNHTWADHANLISVQYAGTGALKTDYTRTGKVIEIPFYFLLEIEAYKLFGLVKQIALLYFKLISFAANEMGFVM